MNRRLVVNLLGRITLLLGVTLLFGALYSIILHDRQYMYFILSSAVAVGLGTLMQLVKPKDESLRPKDGFLVVALSWILISLVGALPFFISRQIPNYIDALFETVSGFTTTGATILNEIEGIPMSLLVYRSFTHWLGGMGVLVLSLALLPKMGARSAYLMRAEASGPNPEKLVPRIGKSSKIQYAFYLSLTLLLFIILLCTGMDVNEALIHAFSTAGTGGFSSRNSSVASFNNPTVEIVISVFMLLFGINFTIYYLMLTKNPKAILKNMEVRVYLIMVALATLFIGSSLIKFYNGDIPMAFRQSFFQVTAIISTTGFASTDFGLWPVFSKMIIIMLMITGSCAGSTAGGMKIIRVIYLFKAMKAEIRHAIKPRRVQSIKVDQHSVTDDLVENVLVFIGAYFLLVTIASLVLALDGVSFETAFTAAISMLSNVGPCFGDIGPMGNYASFSGLSKIVMSFCMLAGRLEIFPMLILLTPETWKKG